MCTQRHPALGLLRASVQLLDWAADDANVPFVGHLPMALDNELRNQDFVMLDWVDLDLCNLGEHIRGAPGPPDSKIPKGALSWAHIAFDCKSHSYIRMKENGRAPWNNFMGNSELAYESNVRLLHGTAFLLIMRRRYPAMAISAENPKATLRLHPLVSLWEKAALEGGLELTRVLTNYCPFEPNDAVDLPQKDTHFWGDEQIVTTLEDHVCVCKEPHLVKVRGQSMRDRKVVTSYPEELSKMVVQKAALFARSQARRWDLGVDGYFNICGRCEKNLDRGDRCCSLCPRAFHEDCLSAWKYQGEERGEEEGWLCPVCKHMGVLPEGCALRPWEAVSSRS